MLLQHQRRPKDANEFPTVQLFLLAIVRLAEPVALTSIFPYAWALVKRFQIGDEQDASFYAGLLVSSFSLAEAAMGMYWGGLSDRVGRKPVLMIGCVGTMISLLIVGIAPNFWVALLGRALGGLLNGNVGVIQTMVGELVTNPAHEPRAFSVMPFVWAVGTIIGPAIGGLFSDPHESFPALVPEGSLFHRLPYLLPNILCSALMLISIILGYFLLEETHPCVNSLAPFRFASEAEDEVVNDETPLLRRPVSYGTTDVPVDCEVTDEKPPPSINIFANRRIMVLIVSLSIFTYHSMTFDHLLPIFFEDGRVSELSTMSLSPQPWQLGPLFSPGGLGLSVRAVGGIMAVNGLIALFVQAIIFPFAAEKIGVYRLFIVVAVLHPIIYALMPFLLYVPQSMLYAGIYFCLAVRNVLSIVIYPLLLILIKEASPGCAALGKINGLAASAGAACRMIAPPIAGYLYMFGSKINCTALAWYGSVLVAMVGSVQCFSVKRRRDARESSA